MVKVNKSLLDIWSFPHFGAGFLFGRFTDLNVFQFSAINIGFELFESWLKKRYDIFNVPFGRETVFESKWNSVMDTAVTTGGFLAGRWLKVETFRPMLDFIAENYKYPLVGAEIGVYRGDNTLRMFRKFPIKHIYLIDPYVDYEELTCLFRPDSFEYPLRKLNFYRDKITAIMKKSDDAAPYVPNNLDFVYIDGCHLYEYIKRDIELYYPKIKKGGVIGGHDIASNPFSQDIAKAVNEFVTKYDLELQIQDPDWWVVKK